MSKKYNYDKNHDKPANGKGKINLHKMAKDLAKAQMDIDSLSRCVTHQAKTIGILRIDNEILTEHLAALEKSNASIFRRWIKWIMHK